MNKLFLLKLLGLFLFIQFCFTGCVSYRIDNLEEFKVDGVQYGVTRGNFRARWWNFYERGRSFAEGGFWKQAESDFRLAISRLNIDHRQSRTYGLRFIPYFGNRELGITLYHQGKFDEAISYLKRSLEQDPSEKTEYYLNLCHQTLSKNLEDGQSPSIQVDAIPSLTNESEIILSGIVSDNLYVDSVVVGESHLNPILKTAQLSFRETLKLQPGTNHLQVEAKDTKGNISSKIITIFQDNVPPQLALHTYSSHLVIIEVEDAQPTYLDSKKLKNLRLTKRAENQFFFRPVSNKNSFYVEIVDEAGNRNGLEFGTQGLKLGSLLPAPSDEHSKTLKSRLIASTELFPGIIADKAKNSALGRANNRLKIDLPSQKMDVFQESILIPVELSEEFISVSINKQKTNWSEKGRYCFRQKLEPGLNQFYLTAVTKENVEIVRPFEIQRHPVAENNRELRAVVGLCPISLDKGHRPFGENEFDRLLVNLDKSERFRFRVKQEDIELIKREFGFIRSGFIDRKTAVKIGKLQQADYTLVCTIRPTKNDIEIFARLVDVETRRILANCDVYEILEGEKTFRDTYARFAEKLAQDFPVVQQELNDFSGRAILNLGKNANIKKGMKFRGFHRGKPLKDPLTGEILVEGKLILGSSFIAKKVKQEVTYLAPKSKKDTDPSRFVVSF